MLQTTTPVSGNAFSTKLRVALAAASLVVLGLAGITWKLSQNAVDGALLLTHTHQVLDQIAAVRNQTLLAEMTTQNFRITGDPAYLRERDAALARRELALQALQRLTADNPGQQVRWQQLRAVTDQRRAISMQSERLRKTEGEAAATAFVASAPLKETRERMLGLLDAMAQHEEQLLTQRTAEQARQRDNANVAGVAVWLLLLALLVTLYWLVSRQLRALSRSQRELARFKGALDQTLDCIYLIDPLSLRFIYANLGAQQQVGYSQAELLTMTSLDLKPEYTEASFRDLIAPLVQGSKPSLRFETMHRHKDGHLVPVEMFFQVVRSDATAPVCVAVAHDISERKRVEQEILRAKEAAELANHAKDSFLATMSHEIRTPLGGMLGMLELLSLSKLDREQGETLQAARDSGRSLLRILNDILDWSKIQEGKLELAEQDVSIPALVAEVANTYSHVASGNSVTLSTQVDPRLAAALRVDPLRLSQVLNNFVSNAIKFNHAGRVQIRAELLEQLDDAQRLRFSVQDQGIGMSPELQQRLFQSYGQGSADTARMYGGTGLGLAISRRLANLLDGHIEVLSALGQGSTFSITLTLALATAPQTQPQTQPEPNAADETPAVAKPFVARALQADAPRVLVVDDHPLNRKLLVRQLALLGLNADSAENGEVALDMWRKGGYALVISDCHMPVMDGYTLTRQIRALEAAQGLARLPVFAWTANALPEEITHCDDAGMDELLIKPAELAQLETVLAKWLSVPQTGSSRPNEAAAHTVPVKEPTPPAVDISVLQALIGDDAAITNEFLQDFSVSAQAIAAELLAACAAGDAAQVGALAHKLKSSARSVGALALGECCVALEAAGKAGHMAALPALAQRFKVAMREVEETLDKLLINFDKNRL